MIYIQFHFTTHGSAYFKHIISHFYHHAPNNKIESFTNLSQEELQTTFDDPKANGFKFKKIVYLYTDQSALNTISTKQSREIDRKNIFTQDEVVENLDIKDAWQAIITGSNGSLRSVLDDIDQYKGPKKKKMALKSTVWRIIQHYDVAEQLEWLKGSNMFNAYSPSEFQSINLSTLTGLNDLRNHKAVVKSFAEVIHQIRKQEPNEPLLINISLGSYETQVAWFVLAENQLLPSGSKFIATYDDKASTTNRFKQFSINQVPTDLFTELKTIPQIFTGTKSKKRELADSLMRNYLEMGFSILIIGERGTGKSQLAEKYKGDRTFVSANCASFEDDGRAEAELFGYKKGAYSGANESFEGLFSQAHGGILFLDEVHLLSKVVQGKLMKALQTDSENFMRIRGIQLTEKKVKLSVIFATNQPIEKLKENLLPDFYDRIAQLVIEIPSLSETREDLEQDFCRVYDNMKFKESAGKKGEEIWKGDSSLATWIKGLQLYGNYRDLQKIAILYASYLNFPTDLKRLLQKSTGCNTAFEFTKAEFEKNFIPSASESSYFSANRTPEQMISLFKVDLVKWAKTQFGSVYKAHDHFKKIDPKTVQPKTMYDWLKESLSL